MRALVIVGTALLGFGICPAQARDLTKCSSEHLEECSLATYVCKKRGLGTQFFTGASKRGAQDWIALKRATDAGYNINDCDKAASDMAEGDD
jgi:hypothetical protein